MQMFKYLPKDEWACGEVCLYLWTSVLISQRLGAGLGHFYLCFMSSGITTCVAAECCTLSAAVCVAVSTGVLCAYGIHTRPWNWMNSQRRKHQSYLTAWDWDLCISGCARLGSRCQEGLPEPQRLLVSVDFLTSLTLALYGNNFILSFYSHKDCLAAGNYPLNLFKL